MSSTPPQSSWNLGVALLALNPFIALVLVLFDLPTWAEVVLVVLIVALVAAGSTLMRRQDGAWLPSKDAPGEAADSAGATSRSTTPDA